MPKKSSFPSTCSDVASFRPTTAGKIRVWCQSLGCPKNRVDTETLLGSLGLEIVHSSSIGRADLVFINTCGFIEPAVRESVRSVLDAAEKAGKAKRRPFLAVGGCMVGRYGKEELSKEIPEVDLWLETKEMPLWASMLRAKLGLEGDVEPSRLIAVDSSYAWLKISEGCRHRCSFCTIPSIRGGLSSRPKRDILEEARLLLATGAKELVLIAQDLTDYGVDDPSQGNLVSLLEDLSSLDGLVWLRMLYLYPKGITPELLRFIKERGRPLLPYFDIPLQHSHPDILKSMGRPFSADPERVCDSIREILPEAAIRTTLITGYPGETDACFEHLCSFVERMRFTQLGVFPFWAEEGSVAASLPNQIEQTVKEERRDAIMSMQRDISHEILEASLGATEDVLVDAPNPEWPGLHDGRVWFQAPEVDGKTYISGPKVKQGAMVRAEIVDSSDYDLTALSSEEE